MELGERLAKVRKEKGFKQKDLAERLNMSQQVISNIERNTTAPDIEFLSLSLIHILAAYTERQNRKFGHPIHAALLGKCGYEYLTVLLGVPCAGGITYPADIQLNNETLVENFEKSDIDILFYDRDFISQV